MKNNSLYDAILSSNKNINKDDLLKAQKGDVSGVLSSLNSADAKKLKEALNDKQKAKQILSSDAAQKILKALNGK